MKQEKIIKLREKRIEKEIKELEEELLRQIEYLKLKWTKAKIEMVNDYQYVEDDFMIDFNRYLWIVEGMPEELPVIHSEYSSKNGTHGVKHSTENGSFHFGYSVPPDFPTTRGKIYLMTIEWIECDYDLDYLRE